MRIIEFIAETDESIMQGVDRGLKEGAQLVADYRTREIIDLWLREDEAPACLVSEYCGRKLAKTEDGPYYVIRTELRLMTAPCKCPHEKTKGECCNLVAWRKRMEHLETAVA